MTDVNKNNMQKKIDDYLEDERKKNATQFSKIWWQSRYDAHVSQEQLALSLGVSRKTIQNWEKGVSSPTLLESVEWFHVLGLNPMPYYMSYLYPEEFDNITARDSDERVEQALMKLVEELPVEAKRQLLFLLLGTHGSSPVSVINLMTAHLQAPMRDRISHATHIVEDYEIERDLNNLSRPENTQPDIDLIKVSIDKAKEAVRHHQTGYTSTSVDPREDVNN